MDLKNVDPNSGNVAKKIQSLYNFSFLKIVKIEPANKVQSLLYKEIPLVPIKYHFSYLSLH
jgi:hypothetical protein